MLTDRNPPRDSLTDLAGSNDDNYIFHDLFSLQLLFFVRISMTPPSRRRLEFGGLPCVLRM
jgi:hypothetical protein